MIAAGDITCCLGDRIHPSHPGHWPTGLDSIMTRLTARKWRDRNHQDNNLLLLLRATRGFVFLSLASPVLNMNESDGTIKTVSTTAAWH